MKIKQNTRNKPENRILQGSQKSEKAAKSKCPHMNKCGACQWLDMPYEIQLKKKHQMVVGLLKQYGSVEPVVGMDDPFHYRHKVHAAFGVANRKVVSGIYEESTHKIVPVERCMIENEKADEIIVTIRELLGSFKIKAYDEKTGYGLLRHVLIRCGYTSGQIMVILVTTSPVFPSKNNFVKALRDKHPEISTVVLNVNDKRTSMVLGEKEQVLYGKGYIEDSLCGKTFRISPKSFYQVNPNQTEKLYQLAVDMAGLTGKESVLDAYCGTGTIGIVASEKAKEVIGVELNKDAIKDAIINAKQNGAGNIQFYQNDSGVFMQQMAAKNAKVDVVFMDPPRTGSDEAFLNSLAVLKPAKVVYVSCNLETLARDLKYITKKEYQVQKIVPVDMFPHTESHVETVVLLETHMSKRKAT